MWIPSLRLNEVTTRLFFVFDLQEKCGAITDNSKIDPSLKAAAWE
jgi:hypothetical protein